MKLFKIIIKSSITPWRLFNIEVVILVYTGWSLTKPWHLLIYQSTKNSNIHSVKLQAIMPLRLPISTSRNTTWRVYYLSVQTEGDTDFSSIICITTPFNWTISIPGKVWVTTLSCYTGGNIRSVFFEHWGVNEYKVWKFNFTIQAKAGISLVTDTSIIFNDSNVRDMETNATSDQKPNQKIRSRQHQHVCGQGWVGIFQQWQRD